MLVINRKSPRFESACTKAKECGTVVTGLCEGRYEVNTPPLESIKEPLGSFYIIEFDKHDAVIRCTNQRTGEPCKAHSFGNVCYHAAAVLLNREEVYQKFLAEMSQSH